MIKNIDITINNCDDTYHIISNSFLKFVNELIENNLFNIFWNIIKYNKLKGTLYNEAYKIPKKNYIISISHEYIKHKYINTYYTLRFEIRAKSMWIFIFELTFIIRTKEKRIICKIDNYNISKYKEIYKIFFKDHKNILKNIIYNSINKYLYYNIIELYRKNDILT